MSHVAEPTAPRTDPGRRLGKLLLELLMISAPVSFLMTIELVGNRFLDNRWDWDIHEISVLKDVIIVPILIIIVRYFMSWANRRREVFFASIKRAETALPLLPHDPSG